MIFPFLLAALALTALAAGGTRPSAPAVTAGERRARGRVVDHRRDRAPFRPPIHPPIYPPAYPPGYPPAPEAPSAERILVECLRLGRTPSPPLIAQALAEAQRLGHGELVDAIVTTYIRPVVDAAEVGPGPSTWSVPAPTLYSSPAGPPAPAPAYGAPYASYPPPFTPGMPSGSPEGYPSGYPTSAPTDAASASASAYPDFPNGTWSPPGGDPIAPPGSPAIPLDPGASDDDILRMMAQMAQTAQTATNPGAPPVPFPTPGPGPAFDPTLSAPGGASTGSGTVTVSGRSSPIDGVGTPEWSRFCDRVSRELPTYMTAHHVGQFRQRKDRLVELGIDPETVVASQEHQQAAFDADMAQAYQRAHQAGLLACVGGAVSVPTPDAGPQVVQVTTSGVLGVVQAAGIDGALGWFRSPEDRRRFAGTTAVFTRANGVF